MKKITTFWSWFLDNQHTIQNLIHETPENQKNISYWIHKNLSYYCSEIDFIIVFPKRPWQQTEFIISSNGNPDYVRQVIDLIDNAPVVTSWKFTAFITPNQLIEKDAYRPDKACIIQDISLKADALQFTPLKRDETSKKRDVIIHIKNNQILCNNESLDQAIFFILQDLLGKNILYQKINLVHLAKLPDTEEENLIHLYDLQFYIDNYNTKTHHSL